MKIDAVSIDGEVMGGVPVFKETRVPVESLFQWLETETMEEFLENFPTVSKAQAVQVLEAAGRLITSEKVLHEIFLDENIPVQLKKHLGEADEWVTVKELNWQGTKNGLLLQMLSPITNLMGYSLWTRTCISSKTC